MRRVPQTKECFSKVDRTKALADCSNILRSVAFPELRQDDHVAAEPVDQFRARGVS